MQCVSPPQQNSLLYGEANGPGMSASGRQLCNSTHENISQTPQRKFSFPFELPRYKYDLVHASLLLCEYCMSFCNRVFSLLLYALTVLCVCRYHQSFILSIFYKIINHASICISLCCCVLFFSTFQLYSLRLPVLIKVLPYLILSYIILSYLNFQSQRLTE